MAAPTRYALRLTFALLSVGLLVLQKTTIAECAVIDPMLASKMANAPGDSLLHVVIRPHGTIEPAQLKADVTARFRTRAEQHRDVISALMQTSHESQRGVLDALKSQSTDSEIEDVRQFWIDNVITAKTTAAMISLLASRNDIERISLMPDVSLVTPLSAGASGDAESAVTQNHIRAIKADSVWMAGYTGKRRLVGSLDTGVDGKHFALTNRWRGHNGGSIQACWYNPLNDDTIPRVFSGTGTVHGTQVMGLMVGILPQLGDTIGACPDCDWISAAAIDIPCPGQPGAPCGNLFDALQWIADPDGDPNTEWDAPDAVANPWGAVTRGSWNSCDPTGIGCSDIFWNAIDNIEAAGTLMIFAAGNEGNCGAMTIRNPANRISSSTNAFSVGMVDTRTNIATPPVDPLSSQGPSDCDQITVKPEVTAPGVNLRTTTPNGGVTTSAYGTSFATPLVAAGAALLREYNPNATVDQIKLAMLAGAKDLGKAGPDNSYGHGVLDLMDALRNLPANTEPALYVMRDLYAPPSPGSHTDMTFVLRNCGTPARGVHLAIHSSDSRLTIIDGQSTFADMPAYGDTASNASDPFEIAVHALCIPGERLPMTIEITADGGYSRVPPGMIVVGPPSDMTIFTHDAGNFKMTVGATGTFGHQPAHISPRPDGIGYLYASDPTQSLFDGAFMVGTGPSQISDNARNEFGSSDVDFRVGPGGLISVREPGEQLAEEARSGFDDSYAEHPIGLFIEQRTMASDLPGHGDYLLVEFTIHNRSGEVIENLHCGLFLDWDFPWTGSVAGRDGGGFDAASGVGWMRHRDENRYRAVCVVSGTPLSGYRYFDNYSEIYDGLSELEKWTAMTGGAAHATPVVEGDASHAIGSGPFTLGYGESTKVAFAVIGGTSGDQILESAERARAQYSALQTPLNVDIMPGVCPNELSTWGATSLDLPSSAKAAPPVAGVSIALLGSADLNVFTIDAASVSLAGLTATSTKFEDVGAHSTIRESGPCDCNSTGPDGFTDLVVGFERDEVTSLLTAGETPRELKVSARSTANVSHVGTDCLRLIDGPISPRITGARNTKARLGVNSPNPFNATTQIEVTVESSTQVKLEVLDVLGRRVRLLVDDILPDGQHEIIWNGSTESGEVAASGIYFARLTVLGEAQVSKMLLLK